MNFLCFFCIEPKSRRVIRDNLYIFLSLFRSFLPYCGYTVLNVARSILEMFGSKISRTVVVSVRAKRERGGGGDALQSRDKPVQFCTDFTVRERKKEIKKNPHTRINNVTPSTALSFSFCFVFAIFFFFFFCCCIAHSKWIGIIALERRKNALFGIKGSSCISIYGNPFSADGQKERQQRINTHTHTHRPPPLCACECGFSFPPL